MQACLFATTSSLCSRGQIAITKWLGEGDVCGAEKSITNSYSCSCGPVCERLGTGAQEMRVALVDFVVHSDNPKYTYLGKGISEMITMELANSPGVALVDREQRTELMEEMKFALSGLADDTERQIELGMMLAADYIVFDEIVDMAPQLLISVRVTGVVSGEVVYQDNVTERPGRYEDISGYFASNILDHFDVKVARSTEKKVEEKEAVVAFSRALAAYDTGEEEEAKKELVEAKRIDPGYEAA